MLEIQKNRVAAVRVCVCQCGVRLCGWVLYVCAWILALVCVCVCFCVYVRACVR